MRNIIIDIDSKSRRFERSENMPRQFDAEGAGKAESHNL